MRGVSAERPTQAATTSPPNILVVVWTVLRRAVAALLRTLHLLWLDVTGLFFVVFSLVGAAATWREYQAHAAGKVGPGRAIAAALFCLVFAYFGFTSFWKARKGPRQK
jgi:hypothetical protein